MARPVTKSKQIEILEAQVLHYRNCFKAMGEGVHDGRRDADCQIMRARQEASKAKITARESVEKMQDDLRQVQGLLNVSERQIKGYREDAETAKKEEDSLYLDLQAVKQDHASAVAYGDLQLSKLNTAKEELATAGNMLTDVNVPWQLSNLTIRLAFFMGAVDRSRIIKYITQEESCES